MKTILIVEDDQRICELLKDLLSTDYKLKFAYSGSEALLVDITDVDLILLDMMLPGKNGDEVLKEIRQVSEVPIIMLTSISDNNTIVNQLKEGANDYVTKPFDIDVLLARIEVQLRNNTNHKLSKFKNLEYKDNEFFIKGKSLSITRKEIDILSKLLLNPHTTYTKEMLYEEIWQDDYIYDDNTINVHISSLRKKLKEADNDNDYIQTVWGVGIKLASDRL